MPKKVIYDLVAYIVKIAKINVSIVFVGCV